MKKLFLSVLALTLLVKIWLAASLPFIGDEAFFYWWGVMPAWGYYDHPPMVGWMIAATRVLGESPFVLRLPTILLTTIVAFGIADLIQRLRPDLPNAGWLAAAIYLLLPISWIGVLVTTDTPLIFFLFGAGYALIRSELAFQSSTVMQPHGRGWLWLMATGILLGLAVLSKYFAAVMALAIAVALLRPAALGGEGSLRGLFKLFLVAICALPFLLLNLAYNAQNCWSNIMFNVVNRHESAAWGIENLLVYLGMMVYLLTPWVVWQAFKNRQRSQPLITPAILIFVPLVFFLLISLRREVGLHWVLAFIPFFFVLAGLLVPPLKLKRSVVYTAGLSSVHLAFFIAVLMLPLSVLEPSRLARDLGFLRDAQTLPALLLQDAPADTQLMARAYTPASLLGFHAKQYVPVFGVGRHHARQDDVVVDFRELNGKTLRIFDRTEPSVDDFIEFFDQVKKSEVSLEGRRYWVIEGQNFNYAQYRNIVLAEIHTRFYQIPAALPLEGCPFRSRYGFTP